MTYRIEISPRPPSEDVRGRRLVAKAWRFLHLKLAAAYTRDVYWGFGDVTPAEAERLATGIANPVIHRGVAGTSDPGPCDWLVIVGYLPGVTDNVARTLRAAARDLLGRRLAETDELYSTVEYFLTAPDLTREQVADLARQLLANPLIQSLTVLSAAEWRAQGIPPHRPVFRSAGRPQCERLAVTAMSDPELKALSDHRTLALTVDELHAVQAYFRAPQRTAERAALGLGPDPTDTELEALAQTWSEHCKHKIFSALIEYTDEHGHREVVDHLFKSYIQRSTSEIGQEVDWLLSVFKDNAGVIAFNDEVDLVYKVETHNSPSALDPYGGAMTGIVGVNRDPMGTGMGANLLFNVWGYCLGQPETPTAEIPAGLLHPRYIRDGVHQGVIEGGNQSGIPYAVGWEYFDQRYLGKPLVFCGTVGCLPKRVGGQPGYQKDIRPGDRIVMVGGRIGKDGIHGATFSSEELHTASPVQAVQIGDPITQKMMYDFLLEARDLGLYRFLTDNGAGGLSSSLGEMATWCGGCRFDLGQAPLKYAGLQPWEILLSEAQERMSLAVPPEQLAAFLELAQRREVEATVLGEFTASGKFHVEYHGETVACLDLDFLHEGFPRLQLRAKWTPPQFPEPVVPPELGVADALCRILSRLNICSDEAKARQYDHEVKGLSVIKPFVGLANDVAGDAAVFMIKPLSREGVVLSAAILPRYSDLDTYWMVASVIDLAVRRALTGNARLDHIAGLDNFCWPDPVVSDKTPDGEYKLAQLVRANRALYDFTRAFRVPCISGKDSMKNDSTKGGRKISIPPTLLFSTIARTDDVSKAVTLDAKQAGDLVYVLGTTHAELGASEFYAMLGGVGSRVPRVDAPTAVRLYQAVATALHEELLHSLHAPGLGGLGVGLAKVAIGGRLGLTVDLDRVPVDPGLTALELLFAESNSRLIATVPPAHAPRFEALLAGLPAARVGVVTAEPQLRFTRGGTELGAWAVAELVTSYTGALNALEG